MNLVDALKKKTGLLQRILAMKQQERSLNRALKNSVIYPKHYQLSRTSSRKYPDILHGRSAKPRLSIRILEPNLLRSIGTECAANGTCQGPPPDREDS